MRQSAAKFPGMQKSQRVFAAERVSLLLTSCPLLAFAGWDAFVLAVGRASVSVAFPAGFAVGAFLFAGRGFTSSHQIEKAAISTGVQGR